MNERQLSELANRLWYQRDGIFLLKLCSWFYGYILKIKKRFETYFQYNAKAKIIIVGNINVGGTGKTPFAILLANYLSQYTTVGILSRGYKASSRQATWVEKNSDPRVVGDEPLLIKQKTNLLVLISKNRVQGVKLLEKKVRVIICDDGLQHYYLARDYEFALINQKMGLGNKYLLPAGPLREPVSRLKTVDSVIYTYTSNKHSSRGMQIDSLSCHLINRPEIKLDINIFKGKRVHALAGIAHPESFFALLESQGLNIIKHAFPDHVNMTDDFIKNIPKPCLITEKDAVKLMKMKIDDIWVIVLSFKIDNLVLENCKRAVLE